MCVISSTSGSSCGGTTEVVVSFNIIAASYCFESGIDLP